MYGSRCVRVTGVIQPARDQSIPCQPAAWVDGTTEWKGTVIGCPFHPGIGPAMSGRPVLFGWLPNPFQMLSQTMSPSSGSGADEGRSHIAVVLGDILSLSMIACAIALLLLAVRLVSRSRAGADAGPLHYEQVQLQHPLGTRARMSAPAAAAYEPQV
uniref:Uncharacterized protein n=1 Tax=Strombidinopsis acuminata TaxID=141414 RepID=A0A7S3T4P2_9SPIT